MLQRLDAINRTSGEIIAGDLTRRVPRTGSGDEFDTLAENLNRMLDRIERLMKGLREVTDLVAHDLRTPLNRLRNRLEESVARLNASGTQAGEIERAIAETDQLIGTFNALLLIAETDAGTTRAAMTVLDLAVGGRRCAGIVRAAGGRARREAHPRAGQRGDRRQSQPDRPGAGQSGGQCHQVHAGGRGCAHRHGCR